MSNSQVKNLSKNELKSMLMKMGTSLDKNDHPKSYYEKLYLEKMNAKNKRTRSNNIFGREQILKTKRERNDIKVKEDDEEYVIEEEEEVENNSNQKEEGNSEDENLWASGDVSKWEIIDDFNKIENNEIDQEHEIEGEEIVIKNNKIKIFTCIIYIM